MPSREYLSHRADIELKSCSLPNETDSIGINGVVYPLPTDLERDKWLEEVRRRAAAARDAGKTVVVVQGLGFVGAVMAAVVANSADASGEPRHFVIGVDLPRPSTFWKVGMINNGEAPVVSSDPAVGEYVARAVRENQNLVALADERAFSLADVVLVDVQLDVEERLATAGSVQVVLDPFREAIAAIGRHMSAGTLVVIETTVPPGTTSLVVAPILARELKQRGIKGEPLVAHSYERVMPGPNYVRSIESFWRTFAGLSSEAADRAEAFLSTVVNTSDFPLRRLEDPTASELAKVLENSYRAANIAFIQEWTLAAEELGVNLFEVVDSVAVRRGTHDNIMRPGFGVGGYCLTKDGYLAQWGVRELFGGSTELGVTLRALDINYQMPRHSFDLLQSAMGDLRGKTVLVAGISYLGDVADTRNSPTAEFCDLLLGAGARPLVSAPHVRHWPERPSVPWVDFEEGFTDAGAVVLAVRHAPYLKLDPEIFAGKRSMVLLDTQNLIDDVKADRVHALGHLPVGVGKGHWRKRYIRA